MSVKNTGSKLAKGVRQIKARQDKTSSTVAAENIPARVVKAEPVATMRESDVQHPERVWPD